MPRAARLKTTLIIDIFASRHHDYRLHACSPPDYLSIVYDG